MSLLKHGDSRAAAGSPRRKCGVSESLPTLYYFDGPGLAEAIRFCFAYGNVDFVDVRFQLSEWPSYYKKISPTGTAPWLEVDGEQYAESQAILQYAAKRSGLIPHNYDHYVNAMTIIELKEAISKKIYPRIRELIAQAGGLLEHYEAYEQAVIKLVDSGEVSSALKPLEEMVASTQDKDGHVVGEELTFADMSVATYVHSFTFVGEAQASKIQSDLPHLYKCMEAVYALPSINKWVLHHVHKAELHCDAESVDGRILRIAMGIAKAKYTYKKSSDRPRITIKGNTIADGFRPCCLWINSRYNMIPTKSHVQMLGMWSLVDLIYNMSKSWGTAIEAERETLKRVNQCILKTQSREGFCIGHSLTFADIAAAAFYEFYMSGHPIGVEAHNLEGFKNAHRVVYQIPNVATIALPCESIPTFVYFNLAGRGEAIRFLCYAANIKFNDVRVPMKTWAESEYKKQSPNGKLPYMQFGELTLSESSAILTFLAARCDMLPSTLDGDYLARAIESALHDTKPIIGNVLKASTKEERIQVLKTELPQFLDSIEALIKSNKPKGSLPQYLVEERLTYADFSIAALIAGFPEEIELDMTPWTSLKAIYDHVISLPQIARYREQRGPTESLLCDSSA